MKRHDKIYIAMIVWLIIIIVFLTLSQIVKDLPKQTEGFNTELPQGKKQELETTKSKEYENIQPQNDSVISLKSFIEKDIKTLSEIDTISTYNNPLDKVLSERKKPQKTKSVYISKDTTIKIQPDTIKTDKEEKNLNKKREFISPTITSSKRVSFPACIYKDQKIENGGRVRIKTMESFETSGFSIPKGTILTGIATYDNDRIKIEISSLKFQKNILMVKLSVYDNDANEGIYYPLSTEEENIKNTSSNLSRRIGEVIGTSSAIGSIVSGGVDYLSEKSRSRSAILKDGYNIYIVKL